QLEVTTNTYDEDRVGYKNIGQLTTTEKELNGVLIARQMFDYDGEGHASHQQWFVVSITHTLSTGFAPTGGEVLWRAYPNGVSVGSSVDRWTYDKAPDGARLKKAASSGTTGLSGISCLRP
ncbi:MAG: hypothetical protein ACREV8_03640, partial [Gammaproteobacteria bacterium]